MGRLPRRSQTKWDAGAWLTAGLPYVSNLFATVSTSCSLRVAKATYLVVVVVAVAGVVVVVVASNLLLQNARTTQQPRSVVQLQPRGFLLVQVVHLLAEPAAAGESKNTAKTVTVTSTKRARCTAGQWDVSNATLNLNARGSGRRPGWAGAGSGSRQTSHARCVHVDVAEELRDL